jgi:hypothetical protein
MSVGNLSSTKKRNENVLDEPGTSRLVPYDGMIGGLRKAGIIFLRDTHVLHINFPISNMNEHDSSEMYF